MSPSRITAALRRLLGLTIAPPVRTSVNPRSANRFRPMLESFEDRMNPSGVIDVTSFGDVTEGGGGGLLFVRSVDTTGDITVNFSIGGTADSSDHSLGTSGTAYFADGYSVATVFFTPINDSTAEPTKTIVFTLTSGTGYTIGTSSTVTMNLLDDDTPVVSVEKIADATEGGSDGTFRFTRIGNLSSSLTANYTITGTATSGTDFTALSGSVTFAANSATADVSVAAATDSTTEPTEAVLATVASGTGYAIGTTNVASVSIFDSQVGSVEVWYDVAAGQSLEATEGVGLLANYTLSSFGSGLAITSIELVGGATNYSPDSPIATVDWGTLTVGTDGSFTFDPDATASGVFLFRFDISDGTNTGHGTAALWVGGSGAGFAPNELTTAPAGTVTYERELTGYAPATDFFTVHDVQFHLALAVGTGGPVGVAYTIFGMKLADVRDAVHVQVSTEVDPKVVESKLVDFTFADGQDLVVHIADVRYALHVAIGDIENALANNYSESGVKAAIDRWFQGQELEDSDAPTQQQVGTILSVYQFVAGDLDGREIRYVNKREAAGYGSAYGKNPAFAGVIEVGDLYFGTTVGATFTGATSAVRFGTVIHELTHTDSENLGHTDDWGGYFSDPDDVSSDLAPVTWWLGEQIYPTTTTLIENADSYAGYLTQYYFLGVPV